MVQTGDLMTSEEQTAVDRSTRDGTVVERAARAQIPTVHGEFTAHAYRSVPDGPEHLAYTMGNIAEADAPLVRLHSECLTGDVLGSQRCDCGQQLDLALVAIAQEQCGVLIYLRGHEGRGIGLGHKIQAYALQDLEGLDTVDANIAQGLPVDSRNYGVGAAILDDLAVTSLRLLTNNPEKTRALRERGFTVTEQVPLVTASNEHNSRYLSTKRDRMGHTLQ